MAWKKFTKIFTSRRGGRLYTPCPDGVDIAYVQTGEGSKLNLNSLGISDVDNVWAWGTNVPPPADKLIF